MHSKPNGTAWVAIPPALTTASALLLPQADRVRFVPTPNVSGPANLYFVAWDGSQGKAAGMFNVVATGGATPFSVSAGDLNFNVNLTPLWVGSGASLPSISPGTYTLTNATLPPGATIGTIFGPFLHDDNAAVTSGVAITSLGGTTNGTWQYSTNGGTNWTTFPTVSATSAVLLAAADLIRFVPKTSTFVGVVSPVGAGLGRQRRHG